MSVDWTKQTVAQLKTELSGRGLDTTGKKAELIERIEKHIAESPAKDENGEEAEEMEAQDEAAIEAADGEEVKEEEVDEEALLAEDVKEEATEEMEADGAEAEGEAADGEKIEVKTEPGEEGSEKKKEPTPEPEEPDQDLIIKDTEVPEKNDMRKDRTREMRFRRVFVWPVEWSDLNSDLFKSYMDQCQFFTFRTLKEEDGKVVNGSIEMQFRTCSLATEATEKLKEIREGAETKQLAPADTEESIRDIKGEKAEEVTERLLYISNLPEEVTDEAVEALFPGAQYVLVSRDREESRKCQGYGYVEYDNAEQSVEALAQLGELTIEEKKITVCHYGHQLVAMGNSDLPEDKQKLECPLEPADWWYFVKVLRGLRKRLYKDVKTMSMIEKKTFFRRLNTVNAKFEEDKKAREEKGVKAKELPGDLQNRNKGQKRPRTFSGGNARGGKQPRRGMGFRPPSLMEVGRGSGGSRGAPAGRGGYHNRNAMNLLMGIEQMLRQSPRGAPRGGRGGPRGGGYSGGYMHGGYEDSYNPRSYNQGGYSQGYSQGGSYGGAYRKPGAPRGRGGPAGGRRW